MRIKNIKNIIIDCDLMNPTYGSHWSDWEPVVQVWEAFHYKGQPMSTLYYPSKRQKQFSTWWRTSGVQDDKELAEYISIMKDKL